MDKHIDAKLVVAFLSGDKAALNSLVKRWHKLFCKKAYWLVKDADLAKDIAQDSWTSIISKIETLNNPESFGNWALRIVYYKSLDTLQSISKERDRNHAYQKEQIYINDEPVDNSAMEKLLVETLKKLPNQQQIVIRLFYLEDYSLKQISELLEISIGTAKSRLFYARETLKQILKNRTYEK